MIIKLTQPRKLKERGLVNLKTVHGTGIGFSLYMNSNLRKIENLN